MTTVFAYFWHRLGLFLDMGQFQLHVHIVNSFIIDEVDLACNILIVGFETTNEYL